MTMLVLGIDPGVGGGLAFYEPRRHLLYTYNTPTTADGVDGAAVAQFIRINAPTHCFIEAVTSRPRQSGVFNFGLNTGVLHGVLMAENVPFTLVSPTRWKGYFGLKRAETQTYRDAKNASRELASKLFPGAAGAFARVKDDGVAEAALLALYGAAILTQPTSTNQRRKT